MTPPNPQLRYCSAPSPKRSFHEFHKSIDHLENTHNPIYTDKRQRYDYDEPFTRSRSPLSLCITSEVNSPASAASTPSGYPFSANRTNHYTPELEAQSFTPPLRDHARENTCESPAISQAPHIEIYDADSSAGPGNGLERLHLNNTIDTPSSFNEEDYDGDVAMHAESNVGPEICFGMIQNSTIVTSRIQFLKNRLCEAIKNHRGGKPEAPTIIEAKIRPLGSSASTVHLSSSDGESVGFLDSISARGIAQILERRLSVRLQAFLPSPQPSPELFEELPVVTGQQNPQSPIFIYINIYGPSGVGDEVGRILSANGICLQSPKNNDRKLGYKNPHYFDAAETFTRLRNVEEKVKTIFDVSINDELPEREMEDELQTSLLSHQKQALYFMLGKENGGGARDHTFANSIWKPIEAEPRAVSYINLITKETCAKPQVFSGGVLADDMGLGKSLTTLALIISSLGQARAFMSTNYQNRPMLNQARKYAKTTLIIAPTSLLASWKEQILAHVKPGIISFYIYHGARKAINIEKLIEFDIVLTTYATIRAELYSKRVNHRRSPLKEIKWFRIVLDEAHIIREQSTQQSKAVCMLEAQHRWCLTGTPIQNKLQDFGTLLRFLRLSPFDKEGTFARYIVRPLKAADPDGLKYLRILIGATCLRRNKEILELPQKLDQEVSIHLDDSDRSLYEAYKNYSAALIEHALTEYANGSSYFGILQSILRLRLMCNHGTELLPTAVKDRLEQYSNPKPLSGLYSETEDCVMAVSPVCQSSEIFSSRCDLCNTPSDPAEAEAISSMQASCSHTICDSCLRQYELNLSQLTSAQIPCPKCAEDAGLSLEMIGEDSPRWMEDIRYNGPSAKVKKLIENLRSAARDNGGEPIKSVVFSSWTKMLDLIGVALNIEKMRFCRYDGRLSIPQRNESIRCFREDRQINILLISIGSGAVGLNLTVASRVHLMEPQWNPMAEHQALDRLHRIGQKNQVITTRYIVKNSIEESILSFQKRKLAIASISLSQTQKSPTSNQHLKELQNLLR